MLNEIEPWERKAECRNPVWSNNLEKNLDWFTTDKVEQYECRAVCDSKCPVRRDCLKTALDNDIIYGIWGGVDDYEIRRALSVDAEGKPTVRSRAPRCPFCLSHDLDISGVKVQGGFRTKCNTCLLTWNIAAIPAKLKKKKIA